MAELLRLQHMITPTHPFMQIRQASTAAPMPHLQNVAWLLLKAVRSICTVGKACEGDIMSRGPLLHDRRTGKDNLMASEANKASRSTLLDKVQHNAYLNSRTQGIIRRELHMP